ncbi:metal-nicotianamine transporter YSL1 [Tanacetum coccineum]
MPIATNRKAGTCGSRHDFPLVYVLEKEIKDLQIGGFGSFLLGLNKKTYEQAGVDTKGNVPGSYKEPGVGWMTSFLFVTSFVGLLALVPLRKIMIIDYKLTYPSGTATAVLINGFHTPKGDKMARKQVLGFAKFFTGSFLWAFFQWFYTGPGTCGFAYFPTFGLKAYINSFYFDFSMTYVGAGMICSHLVNLSLLAGAILSYGVMWPLIGDLKGDWFPSKIPQSSMKSLNGYKVFISIALILGDGLYNFLKVAFIMSRNVYITSKKKQQTSPDDKNETQEDLQINEVFMRESIPFWVAATGYIALSIVSVIIIPIMFPQLKWYIVVVAYLIAPVLGFCNAYACWFLPDMNMALQLRKAFDVGNPDGEYKAPYALVYRNMAILGVEGFSALPQHCLQLCYGFFAFAVLANMVRDASPKKIANWVPLPMAMAVPFLVGAYFAIDMCVGSLVVFVYSKINKKKAEQMVPAIASGLICGDGIWILPASILALAGVKPPICMGFLPTKG